MRNVNLENSLKDTYSKQVESLKFDNKSELMSLYKEPKRTGVGKRILAFQVALIALISVFTIGAAAGTSELASAVFARTEDTSLNNEQKTEIAEYLDERYESVNPDDLEALESMETTENGQVKGNAMFGATLQPVEAEDGTIGYIYRDDLDTSDGSNVNNPSEALDYMSRLENGLIRNWYYVYAEDGTTIIGKFIVKQNSGYYSDEYEPGSPEYESEREEYEKQHKGEKYGFVTNEELEDEVIQAELIDGDDGYEEFAAARTEAMTSESK